MNIAIQDKYNQSPFSIAILRGHFDVARAIIEISFAQYEPVEKKENARYRLAGGEDEDDYEDEDMTDTEDIPVYKQIIDDRFTIDSIGEVSNQVKSKVSPLAIIGHSCSVWNYAKFCMPDSTFTYGVDSRVIQSGGSETLQFWATKANDMTLFKFLLDLETEWTNRLNKKVDELPIIPSFSDAQFTLAIKVWILFKCGIDMLIWVQYGRIDFLALMISHGGAGMKLESLVKKSGVQYHEKPKYYQGLSVSPLKFMVS